MDAGGAVDAEGVVVGAVVGTGTGAGAGAGAGKGRPNTKRLGAGGGGTYARIHIHIATVGSVCFVLLTQSKMTIIFTGE